MRLGRTSLNLGASFDIVKRVSVIHPAVSLPPVPCALCGSSSREEQVLKMRFGVGDGAEHTLEEVGRSFNVTRERIRQIESKALRKLRHPSRSKKLRPFLDATF